MALAVRLKVDKRRAVKLLDSFPRGLAEAG